jgi:pSer/pThr/pTyr-binding forkhead associated (FHA) protein
MEEEDPENPLIQPCICSGSMKYIHLLCLKHWISTRSCEQIDKTNNCCVYIIKEVECELCKTKFPDIINYEGKLYPLLDFSSEFKDYLTLESLTLDKHKNKFIYVVSLLNSSKLKVGRGHKCDILLSDISVTRIHCYMIAEKQKVFLEDNNSKFGTLVLVQTPIIKILEGIPLNIQIGRSYVQCKIKKSFKLFNCCNIEESSNIYSYFNQNEKQIQQHINLIVGKDYNDVNKITENNINNNTFNQKNSSKFNTKFNCNSILIEQDKISDNEYFLMKHKKLTKNMTQAMIDDENDYNKNLLNINIEKNEDNNDSENEEEDNKNLDNNCDENCKNKNKDIDNETNSDNIKENEKNKNNIEEEIDSIHLSDESKDSSST